MPSIRVQCTSCGTRLKAPEKLAGKKTKCPRCKTLLVVPDPGASIESVAAEFLSSVKDTPSRVSNTVPAPEIVDGITFVCPFCHEVYQVAREMEEKRILCRNCPAAVHGAYFRRSRRR